MKTLQISVAKPFSIELTSIASDKSISHRAALFSLLSDKPSKIRNFLKAEDTLGTLAIVQKLGADVSFENEQIVITPPQSIIEPNDVLDCGNSGTTIRLMCGFLSSCEGLFVLTGDQYLRRRPMRRVVEPLNSIGAKIDARDSGNLAPLVIRGSKIDSFNYISPISSAQVKSAMILSALRSDARCYYKEDELSRDHTERMLQGMGANVLLENDSIAIEPMEYPLNPLEISIPSDPSSAFFFAVAAAIIPNSEVLIKNVSLNKTRTEAYRILQKMGAVVEFYISQNQYEPIGDIYVKHAPLRAVEVSENISWLIDELPALSIAFACAQGTSVVKNASELRVKESDRITSVVSNLKLCGIDTFEFEDGYEVIGGEFKPATTYSYGDHRIAMSFAIAGLKCSIKVEDIECIETSFPNFVELLSSLTKVCCDS